MSISEYSPIIIFCYRRSIKELLACLKENPESKESDLIIYSDGYKGEHDYADVSMVREELKKVSGFKSISIHEAETNMGLSESVISGVSEIILQYGRVIVLEDDLLVSENFLSYMNQCLDMYSEDQKIWSVSGYTPPIPYLNNLRDDVFLNKRASSWGWGTWLDRWSKVDWSMSDYQIVKKDKKMVRAFNEGGDDLIKMLDLQFEGKIDSWAIRFVFSQFLNESYSVAPKLSMVKNVGFSDGVGIHNSGSGQKWDSTISKAMLSPSQVHEDLKILKVFKEYHDMSLYTRLGYFLRKHGGYRLAKRLMNLVSYKKSRGAE